MSPNPYFIIAALPADDMNQTDYEIKKVFNMDPEYTRTEIEKMKQSMVDAGFDFDLVLCSLKLGTQPVIDALDKCEDCKAVILGFGMRGHPSPKVAVLLEELIERVRYHPKNVKIMLNWDIPSSLNAAKRALGQE
ncbi:hypothetical protein DIS24_g7361 [Lasiodiplodia hormozganensis]|uniref:Uncharacterized protein n=1 Tax=Lasiodiplodia hormozganensis TaxID=869390 RepID=A0AA39Y871_9PEZI|nr:hypothetical protein DIS24_g7361 [Lasiodiplodia hormozganensis]